MISYTFDNIDDLLKTYDPKVVKDSLFSTIRKLSSQSASKVSKDIVSRYNIKARDLKPPALVQRVREKNGVPVGFLIYTGKRLSLRKFANQRAAQPRVKSARGVRYGARVKVLKSKGSHIVPGGFWGRARAGQVDGANVSQIFQRMGVPRRKPRYEGDEKLRKLTGPSIAHMARSENAIEAADKLVREKANAILAHELDHRLLRKAGLR